MNKGAQENAKITIVFPPGVSPEEWMSGAAGACIVNFINRITSEKIDKDATDDETAA